MESIIIDENNYEAEKIERCSKYYENIV